jgi:hypothetical protein
MSYGLVRSTAELGKVPTAAEMVDNELIVNVTDGKAFLRRGSVVHTFTLGGGSGGSGTVTSVAANVTGSGLSVSGSPITTSGTLTFQLSANLQSWSALAPSAKQDTLVSGTNIKTVNGSSILGSGNLTVSAAAGGSNKQINFNNSGLLGGTTYATSEAGFLTLLSGTSAGSPTGQASLACKQLNTYGIPGFFTSVGELVALQSAFATGNVSCSIPNGGTTLTVIGTAVTAAGTATALGVGNNEWQSIKKLYYSAASSATAIASIRETVANYLLGQAVSSGARGAGFILVAYVGLNAGATVASTRMFAGIRQVTTAPTDVSPLSLTSVLGFGYDSTVANWQAITNNSGAATVSNTGIPKPSAAFADMYRIVIESLPGVSYVSVQLKSIATGATYSTFLSSDLPSPLVNVAYTAYASAGGTATAIGLIHGGHYWYMPFSF